MRFVHVNIERLLFPAAIVALLVTTLLAYWPGVPGPFLFDDYPNIVNNLAIRITSLAPHQLLRAAFSSHSGLLYRPLSMLSFALDYHFFGDSAFSFKLTNVLIHLVNALLILWVTWRLLVNCKRRYRFEWSNSVIGWASVLIASAWALHPLNLTAVLFIVQRMTSLAALFTLSAILAYVYGRERMQAGKTGWPLVWLLTPALGVIGVFCKEDAALLPLYLLVIEWLLFGFRDRDRRIAKNVTVFYIVGLVLPGILGLAYLINHSFWLGYAGRGFTLAERVLTEFRVVFLYVKWTFIPDIRHLALYHDDLAISTGLLNPVTTLLSLLALIALLVLALWQRRRRPLLSLGIMFFFAGQMMESTVLPLELAFEHRNYLPDYGLILAFFSLLLLPVTMKAGGKIHVRLALRWTIAVIVLPVLFGVTLLRAYEWRSYLDFAYYEARHHPQSERALYVLAQAYSNLALAGALKDPQQAIQALSHAAAISTNIMPDVALMLVSAKLKLPVNPAWQQQAKDILLSHPVTVQETTSLDSLVNCLPTDCQALAPTANVLLQAAFQSAQRNGPNPDLWVIYSNYLTFTGHPLNQVIAAMAQAAKLAPQMPQYKINLAKAYIVTGDFTAAQAQIQQLSRLNKFGSLDLDIKELNTNLAAGRVEAAKQHDTVK
jgi:protein O-mannosyl-transferase